MRLLIILLLTVFSATAFAQTNFGIGIGLNNSKFTGDLPKGFKYESKRGLSTTAFLDFQLSDNVQLSLRPSFAQGGGNVAIKDSLDVNEVPIEIPIGNNYLNFATLVKIYEREKIYAFVGPEVNYIFTADSEINGQKVDLSNKLNNVSLSLDIGFGLNFDMFKKPWAVEWQLSQMLTTLTKQEDIQNGLSSRQRSSRIGIALLYKFKR
jgi:hypothetical protein